MRDIKQYISKNTLVFSLIVSVFIIYPNIIYLHWDLRFQPEGTSWVAYILYFFYRYLFFVALSWFLLRQNIFVHPEIRFKKRIFHNLKITTIAYLAYVLISLLVLRKHMDCFTGYLLFQFLVTCILFTLGGHVYSLYLDQQQKIQEIEQLKYENLKSKCDALANQINPHFLFNTLNTLSYLVREENKPQTLEFVSKLSNIFRYILQSDKNGIVHLQEELKFTEAFQFLMETRFAQKLEFKFDIDCKYYSYKLPALSLLPLLENVVMHNVIDSDHKMKVILEVNEQEELVVCNPVFPKTDPAISNGTGLTNLKNRFQLMMGREIRITENARCFSVYLPLLA